MDNDIKQIPLSYDNASFHKEIDLIQSCISRMARNSFLIKGWAITLIVITWAILNSNTSSFYPIFLLIVPIIMFWTLDGYFLRVERMYRKMYSWVIKARHENNFEYLYDLNPARFKKDVASWFGVMWSRTLWIFYLMLVIIVIGASTICILY